MTDQCQLLSPAISTEIRRAAIVGCVLTAAVLLLPAALALRVSLQGIDLLLNYRTIAAIVVGLGMFSGLAMWTWSRVFRIVTFSACVGSPKIDRIRLGTILDGSHTFPMAHAKVCLDERRSLRFSWPSWGEFVRLEIGGKRFYVNNQHLTCLVEILGKHGVAVVPHSGAA